MALNGRHFLRYLAIVEHVSANLTEAEKEVLRAFLTTSDPKRIAEQIGRSHHTVVQRLRRARRKLGMTRTLDAAMELARIEQGRAYIADAYPLHARRPDPTSPAINARPENGPGVPLPFPTKGRPWNALSSWARTGWIVTGMMLLAISTMAVVSLGEALTRVVRH